MRYPTLAKWQAGDGFSVLSVSSPLLLYAFPFPLMDTDRSPRHSLSTSSARKQKVPSHHQPPNGPNSISQAVFSSSLPISL